MYPRCAAAAGAVKLEDSTHFPGFFQGPLLYRLIRRVGGVTYIRFGQKIVNNFHFPPIFQISIMLLYFETRAPRNQTEVTFCIF